MALDKGTKKLYRAMKRKKLIEYKSEKESIDKKKVALGFIRIEPGLSLVAGFLVYSGVELARIAGIPEMIMGLFTLGNWNEHTRTGGYPILCHERSA